MEKNETKERSKERKERKAAVVEEKNKKETTTTTSRAGRAHDEECPLAEVTQADIDWFIDIFNETMIRTSAVIPTVDILTTLAKRQLRYLMERYPMSKLEKMAENAAASDFLNGSGQRGFKADIEWLTREQNFIKVVNNKYANIPHERRWRDPAERIEELRLQNEERRRQNREMEEQDRRQRRLQREYNATHAAKGDELIAIFAEMDKAFDCFNRKENPNDDAYEQE